MALGPGQQKPASMAMFAMIGISFLIATIMVLWHTRHDAFCAFILTYNYWLVYPYAAISRLIGWESSPAIELLLRIIAALRHPRELQFGDMITALYLSGWYTLPLIYFPIKSGIEAGKHPILRLNRKHNSWSLIKAQSLNNPCILPVVRFEEEWKARGMKRHPTLDRSLSPVEWCTKLNLIEINGTEMTLKIEEARAALYAQLGARLHSRPLPDYYKALAVICLIRIIGRGEESRKQAQKLLDQINSSCDAAKGLKKPVLAFDFKSVASQYKELIKSDIAKTMMSRHSFEKTFLMGLLFEARKDGKIPCSQFIWLKMVDRPLFYALQGVTPVHIARGYAEAAGPVAQFWAEMAANDYNQVLRAAYIEKAIPAIEKRLLDAGAITRAKEYSAEFN